MPHASKVQSLSSGRKGQDSEGLWDLSYPSFGIISSPCLKVPGPSPTQRTLGTKVINNKRARYTYRDLNQLSTVRIKYLCFCPSPHANSFVIGTVVINNSCIVNLVSAIGGPHANSFVLGPAVIKHTPFKSARGSGAREETLIAAASSQPAYKERQARL